MRVRLAPRRRGTMMTARPRIQSLQGGRTNKQENKKLVKIGYFLTAGLRIGRRGFGRGGLDCLTCARLLYSMAEPTTLEGSGAAKNAKSGDMERVNEEEKVPNAGQVETEDWKIQAEAFKSEGDHHIFTTVHSTVNTGGTNYGTVQYSTLRDTR